MADGRAQARVEAGFTPAGATIYNTLPPWYQSELATRAADVEALALSVAGPNAVTAPGVEAYYFRVALSQFTDICLRRVATSKAGGQPGTAVNEGCAPMSNWAPWVAAAVSHLPVGALTSPVRRGAKELVPRGCVADHPASFDRGGQRHRRDVGALHRRRGQHRHQPPGGRESASCVAIRHL